MATSRKTVRKLTTDVTVDAASVQSTTKTSPKKTVKKISTQPTQIIAQIDVGFGNRLTIRGAGAGLSWNNGQEMSFVNNYWIWETNFKENIEFKVLLNDQAWQAGENLTVKAGKKVTFSPQF